MKCIEIGERFGLDALRFVERADPTPGPGEVRVKLFAASLNYRDLRMVQGTYNPRQKLPLIPGSDGAGEIDAVGLGVTEWNVGDRVMGCFCPYYQGGAPTTDRLRRALGGPIDGTFAEKIVLPATGVVATPATLTNQEAATLPCAAVTAWNAVVEQGETKPGHTVLIQGTGGVALFALQFAKALGAETIVTSSSDAKLERAKAMGAARVINYKTTPEWAKAAGPCDLVVEVGGAGTLEQSVRATKPGGRVMSIGVLGGVQSQLTLTALFMNNIRLQGVFVGSRDTFVAMTRAAPKHVIDRVFPLAEAREALAYLERGEHFGKVVLSI